MNPSLPTPGSRGSRPRDEDPILPGGTIGVLGSGQLGRMFALAARELGYRIVIFSPDRDTPAGQIGDREFVCGYDDLERVREFARQVDVVTFEFENVPAATTTLAAEFAPVRPDGRVLLIAQNRLREKLFLERSGIPVTPFRRVLSLEDLRLAARDLGLPAVLKTADFGYDGKGQTKLTSVEEMEEAWRGLRHAEGIYEAFVDFEKEISVVGARGVQGEFAAYPVFENSHARHILDTTFAPASLPPALATEAVAMAERILHALDVVGLLTVEMFVTRDRRILVNELAPRTHNSGHLTIDACVTSQFEQQVRAVCGLPLGSTEMRQPAAAMANLLGDLWAGGPPRWSAALEDPRMKLHLYGKAEPRVGRKMGHLTTTGGRVEDCVERVRLARERLIRAEKCFTPAGSIP